MNAVRGEEIGKCGIGRLVGDGLIGASATIL